MKFDFFNFCCFILDRFHKAFCKLDRFSTVVKYFTIMKQPSFLNDESIFCKQDCFSTVEK